MSKETVVKRSCLLSLGCSDGIVRGCICLPSLGCSDGVVQGYFAVIEREACVQTWKQAVCHYGRVTVAGLHWLGVALWLVRILSICMPRFSV
jgi:hypothetical protein